jgi:transcriptional regulator with XRE-family HTH domain
MSGSAVTAARRALLARGLTISGLATSLNKDRSYISLVLAGRVKASEALYANLGRLIGVALAKRLAHEATLTLNPRRAPASSSSRNAR